MKTENKKRELGTTPGSLFVSASVPVSRRLRGSLVWGGLSRKGNCISFLVSLEQDVVSPLTEPTTKNTTSFSEPPIAFCVRFVLKALKTHATQSGE